MAHNRSSVSMSCAVSIIILMPGVGGVYAQEQNVGGTYAVIDSVIITGNATTKDYIILNEMTLKPGSVATTEAMAFDRNRIYSLGLFTRVDLSSDSVGGKEVLYVDVGERWYIIPVPLFGFRDGDPKKVYYGGGILHNNFQGRNQKLLGIVVFGYNPSLALSFSDPLISDVHNLYFSSSLSFSRVRNRSQQQSSLTGDYDELYYDGSGTIGKRFSLYETLGIKMGYQVVHVTSYLPGRTIASDGTDQYLYGSLSYTFDSRDLREYPSGGALAFVYVNKYGFGESVVNYTRLGADLRGYLPLPGSFTFAARVHGTVISGGRSPTYGHVFFGYGERIRGHFKTVYEGENMFGSTIELRYPIIPARDIYFTAVPLPPEFSIWRFGISLGVFADAGVTWFRGEKPGLRSFASGYGAGIRFLLPYSVVVRTEYAFNELRRGQFILDLRQTL
jgi:outer membrane protein assembly factor BamA